MDAVTISRLASEFLSSYDAQSKDRVWEEHREVFRRFWASRIMNVDSEPISEDEADAMIRILDRSGKGNTKHSDAVARTMVSQGTWRRLFNLLRSERKLRGLMDELLRVSTAEARIGIIDQLYKENEGRKNYLTGSSGNVLNAFLVVSQPAANSSVISLKDRRSLIEFLGLQVRFDWESSSIGTKIVRTNKSF